MIFAAFTPDRIPLQWYQLPAAFQSWLQSAGGVAAFTLGVIALATILRKHRGEQAIPSRLLLVGAALTLLFYSMAGTLRLADREQVTVFGYSFASIGGLCALITLLIPMFLGVLRMRWARIWAIARLAFKEAIRSRVVLVFSLMALVFLFYDFFADHGRKPENQLKNFVTVIYWSIAPLFLMTASILGAFNIPNDIKNQSIHTIVTKPVEKLEIVLGRFLGFAGILSLGLLALTVLSYGYILRGITPEAEKESFRARVPVFGNLYFFADNKKAMKFENVGREWDYRSYIRGPHPHAKNTKNYAFWEFDELPSSLESMEWVPFEFTFDIFRLTKGKEGESVKCSFVFADGRATFPDQTERSSPIEDLGSRVQQARDKETANRPPGMTTEENNKRIDELMLDQFRYYQVSESVTDYHTLSILVPGELFKKLREQDQIDPRVGEPGKRKPALVVVVSVTSDSQMVGAARHDLYILTADQPFWINFFKGVIGMWFSFLLVLGVAIACSTYLSGVISWLCTIFLFGTGLFSDYVYDLATGRAVGGGPMEALSRLIERRSIATPADDTPLSGFITGTDDVYRWWLRLFLHIIPDVNRFDLINYVTNGFDISWGEVLFLDNFVYVAGYLLVWVILAYYLLKYREIANPT